MKNFGIICEFNPIHNGHVHLIDEARKLGAERIVCVMSGNAVQRGELALFDKYTRAKAALECGVDLVLELPFPWSCASAEYFSKAGIYILSQFCDTVIFGSECGNIDNLRRSAENASDDKFRDEFFRRTKSGEGSAQTYFDMLFANGGCGFSSNDLLGIEYIRAAVLLAPELNFITVRREGSPYNSKELTDSLYPSSTALRTLWQEERFEDSKKYIPESAYRIFENAYFDGEMNDIYQLSRAVLMYLRLSDPKEFEQCAEAGGGIAHRICSIAHECSTLEELLLRLSTKRYTDTKLKRALLFCLTKVNREAIAELPKYTTLLAANLYGRDILSANRRTGGVKVVTKYADAPLDSPQYILGHRLESIFSLAKMQTTSSGDYIKKSAYIKADIQNDITYPLG